MAVVFAPGDGDECSAKQRRHHDKAAHEVAFWAENVHLPRQKQRQEAQPTKRKTAMPAWEAPPAVVQDVVIGLCADFDGDERVAWCARGGDAAGDQVRARTPDGVFDEVGYEGGEEHGDEEGEEGDVVGVVVGTRGEEVEDYGEEGEGAAVEKHHGCGLLV